MAIIYGVNTAKEITPVMVRDAMIKCFMKAHDKILRESYYGPKKEFEDIERIDVRMLIEKYFSDVGGDFNNPDKESIKKVVLSLKEFAKNFRNPKIIEMHACQINELIDKL